MDQGVVLLDNLKSEALRRINEEGIHRIRKCLGMISDEQIWHQYNSHCNSIGNLILHLCGNVNQWLISTLGRKIDNRDRDSEFDPNNQCEREVLLYRLSTLEKDVKAIVENLNMDDLLDKYEVQCYTETGASIIIHVIEHFSYHVGQITLLTKMYADLPTGYYDGLDLNK